MDKNIKDFVIDKPWGHEYLVFESNKLAIWFLRIEPQKHTSMHCHPNKKTSLIVLSGKAEVSFLYNTVPIQAFNKVMIWSGVFHSTKAVAEDGLMLLEVETPNNKGDLVRLADSYGREGKKYEGTKFWKPKTGEELWITSTPNKPITRYGYKFTVRKLNQKLIKSLKRSDILVSLNKDCIMTKQNLPICKIGDILTLSTLEKFLPVFTILDNAYVLHITQL